MTRIGRAAAAAALAIVAASASGCTSDDTDQNRPTRVVCTDAGKVVLDDFVKLGGALNSHGGTFSYTSETQQGTVSVSGACITRPQAKPDGWKPAFPG